MLVEGELTFASVPTLAPGLAAELAVSQSPELDLAAVTKVNSAALALLLDLQEQAAARGAQLKVLNPPMALRDLAALSNVSDILGLES